VLSSSPTWLCSLLQQFSPVSQQALNSSLVLVPATLTVLLNAVDSALANALVQSLLKNAMVAVDSVVAHLTTMRPGSSGAKPPLPPPPLVHPHPHPPLVVQANPRAHNSLQDHVEVMVIAQVDAVDLGLENALELSLLKNVMAAVASVMLLLMTMPQGNSGAKLPLPQVPHPLLLHPPLPLVVPASPQAPNSSLALAEVMVIAPVDAVDSAPASALELSLPRNVMVVADSVMLPPTMMLLRNSVDKRLFNSLY